MIAGAAEGWAAFGWAEEVVYGVECDQTVPCRLSNMSARFFAWSTCTVDPLQHE